MKHYAITTDAPDRALVALVGAQDGCDPLPALWQEWQAAGGGSPWAFARWVVSRKGYLQVPFTESWIPDEAGQRAGFRYEEDGRPEGLTLETA